ncbi:receptor kinase-like protein Xa21 [Telopea speciosissima]|uniref:receptor kinase-like protein Xa21 n=1 Tax=Telopea speciosissima TaxID=54955 RepID=UPI001CC50C09|nr:receptor kinase-like protein Xa21 [Telopea speciosissima]
MALQDLTQKPDESVSDFLQRAKTIAAKLGAAGHALRPNAFNLHIFQGLRTEFQSMVSSLLTRTDPIAYDDLHAMLLSHEFLHGSSMKKLALTDATSPTNSPTANTVQRSGSSSDSSSQPAQCGGHGGHWGRGRGGRGHGGPYANDLSGSIPNSLGQMTRLMLLAFPGNRLSSTIPPTIYNLSSLSAFDVGDNQLQGSLPPNLGFNLPNLKWFSVSGNQFNGPILVSVSNLSILETLLLSANNFTGKGEVSSDGIFANLSAFTIIGNNKLCGGLPELHLPACQIQKSKEHAGPRVFKLIVIVCGCGGSLYLIFMTFFFIIYRRKKERKESTLFFIGDRHFKISYAQLLKATDGFSSANLIGMGSFGSVYKGDLNHGETIVAVKVLNIRQRSAHKSFMVECESLRNIRHRNLVRILTSCSSIDLEGNDFKALVYEFMPGGNLESWLHQHVDGLQDDETRHLNLVQRINIAIDMAIVLDYLHHHCHTQIIHCDLKPSNILLDGDLTAHLGDFGISRILLKVTSRSQSSTSSIGIKGSIGYIAPGKVPLLLI